MDNGWELLSPEDEARHQRSLTITRRVIKYVYFPLWCAALFFGLYM
jgi:hypothetical protein